MYGFSKVEIGASRGSYFHRDFQKDDEAKALSIQRQSLTKNRLHDDVKNSQFVRAVQPSVTKAWIKVDHPLIKPQTKVFSSANVIICRDPLQAPSSLHNSFAWDSALKDSHLLSTDRTWCSEHLQSMVTSGNVHDNNVFEPRPIELMLCSFSSIYESQVLELLASDVSWS